MKNKELWQPGKFALTKKGPRASRNRALVGIGSRFIGDIQAVRYYEIIKEHAHGRLLDLGCGNVPLYLYYKDVITDNICLDWDNTYHTTTHLDVMCDLNQRIPLANDSFDTILTTDVLEHIANPTGFFAELSRLLKQGGKIILTTPFMYWIHEAPYDYARYTEFQLRRFCEQNDLEILSLKPYGGSIEVMMDILAKHLTFSRLLSAIHLFLAKQIRGLLSGRKYMAKKASLFPLGYCLIATKPLR